MANQKRGVSGPKRKTELERESERLACRGWTQEAIAARLGVTKQQVSYDLQVVRQRHLDSMLSDRKKMVAESAARIMARMRAAWEASERAQLDAVRTEHGEAVVRAHVPGDAAFLRVVGDCEQQWRELFGLDEAAKVQMTGSVMTVDWAALVARRPDVDRVEKAIEAALAGKKLGPGLQVAAGTA